MFAFVDYGDLKQNNFITDEEYNQYYEYSLSLVHIGFDEMKDNIYSQFANPYMKDFFVDNYITNRFMKENYSEIYEVNLTLRSAIF
jgi:hypothetical protein